jgi:hypothetical protein
VDTKEKCIAFLNDFSISTNILCFLPKDDRNDMNTEVASEVLNLLIGFSNSLFHHNTKDQQIQLRSKLEECDCFNILLLLLNVYENIIFKLRISIILGNFYKYVVIPDEGKIIVNILINYLKEQSTEELNEDKNNKLMVSVLNALINIAVGIDKNKKILLNSGIIPLLLPLVNSSHTNICKKTFK